jgi:hypothetical protein
MVEAIPKSTKMLIFILFNPLPLKGKSKYKHFKQVPFRRGFRGKRTFQSGLMVAIITTKTT